MPLPDYQGGSIVNLMTSLITGLGGETSYYPPLRRLEPSRLQSSKNLILLVIDGLGYDYLTRVGSGSTLHQYLKAGITSVFPSTTTTAITTFLTGVAPQQHGLTGWHTYFKELGCVTTVLPFRPRLGGSPLGETGVDAAALFDNVPVFDRIKVRSFVIAPARIINSSYNTVHSGTAERRAYTSLKQFFKTMASTVRECGDRKYIYAYWPELDRNAHEHGISSHQAVNHFAKLDAAFHKFLDHIAGSGTTVIVTADHGIIDSQPDRCIEIDAHPALAESLMLPLCGERRVAYCYVHPDKCGQFERYVEGELAGCTTLFKSEQLIKQGYFGLGPPHPRLRERTGHYTLIMKENWIIKDWLLGERRYTHVGVHGGTSDQEMYVPLIVVTP